MFDGDGGPRCFYEEELGALLEFAEHQRVLAQVDKDGIPWRDHLTKLVDLGRKPDSDLIGPDLPNTVGYLWAWFAELASCRSVGMAGINPINFVDIDAWSRLTGRNVQPYEVRALLDLDRVMRSKGD